MVILASSVSDLKLLPQWVCFTPDKKPINPHTGYGAKANDTNTWGNYDQARKLWASDKQQYAGIGYEFIKEQGITGIDLDHCIDEQGNIAPYAQAIVARLNSYTEYSPSGHGLHIWVLASIPDNIGPDPNIPEDAPFGTFRIEMYDCKRYFTLTGNRLPGTPETFEARQDSLTYLYHQALRIREETKEQARKATKEQARATINKSEGDSAYGLGALKDECQILATTSNGRNNQLNNAAFAMGRYIAGGELVRSTVERALTEAARDAGLDDDEIKKTLRSGLESGMQSPRSAPNERPISAGSPASSIEPDVKFVLECLQQAEWGDSLLFARLFRGRVLYDHTEKEWYLWDTHHWSLDTYGRVKHFVSGQLASVYIRAGATLNIQVSEQEAKAHDDDEDEQARAKDRVSKLKKQIGALTERAFLLRQVARNKNVLTFSATQEGMGITSDKWDRNPWLLAVPNGIVDLKTGMLRKGNPGDYIRTVCPTEWQGIHAPAPRWERFLEEIFEDRSDQEREEIITFLQRIFGYGITGEVREQVFLILFGEDGRNGKDTLQRAMSYALGEVSAAIQKDVLLATDKGKAAGTASPHLMDLQGKRLAWASEPEKGTRFNIGQIKELSGGGDIPARGLFEKKITKIRPSHLLILLTNHKPVADANDSAFWDRLRLVTFNMRYVDTPTEKNERKKDATLWATLENEASGILAWLVRGCLNWQEKGLTTPYSVMNDGKNYRREEDMVLLFLSECCILKEDATTLAGKLYKTYEEWSKGSHQFSFNRTEFGNDLKKKKFLKDKTRNGIIYYGIGLLTPDGEHLEQTKLEVFTQDEPASQASSNGFVSSEREHCEHLNQEVQKNSSHVGENLELTGESIHTIHSGMQEYEVNAPVEPIEEGVNTSVRYSQSGVDTSKGIHTQMDDDVKKKLADFKKKYESKNQVFWTAPKTGIANGYLSPKEWYQCFVQCYNSADPHVREAAIDALKAKVDL